MLKRTEPSVSTIKIILVGDSSVGKSSFLTKYSELTFPTQQPPPSPSVSEIKTPVTGKEKEKVILPVQPNQPTIGLDFKVKYQEIDGEKVKIYIWDTAGQERYRSIVQAYYHGAHGIFLIYDVSNLDSFRKLNEWMVILEREAPTALKFLIGNKIDLIREKMKIEKEEKQKTFQRNETFLGLDPSNLTSISPSCSTASSFDFASSVSETNLSLTQDSSSLSLGFEKEGTFWEENLASCRPEIVQKGSLYAQTNGFSSFFAVSAQSGEEVVNAFQFGIKKIFEQQKHLRRFPHSPRSPFHRIQQQQQQQQKQKQQSPRSPHSPETPLSSLSYFLHDFFSNLDSNILEVEEGKRKCLVLKQKSEPETTQSTVNLQSKEELKTSPIDFKNVPQMNLSENNTYKNKIKKQHIQKEKENIPISQKEQNQKIENVQLEKKSTEESETDDYWKSHSTSSVPSTLLPANLYDENIDLYTDDLLERRDIECCK